MAKPISPAAVIAHIARVVCDPVARLESAAT